MKEVTKYNNIQEKIFTIRGVQVMLDRDLAQFYDIKTKRLNETVNRNIERFPSDFMFQLTLEEKNDLVAICDHLSLLKFSSALPYAFTEQGVSMLAGLLRSHKAIEVNIEIIRAFVQMRQFFLSNKDTFQRLNIIETKLLEHDTNFNKIFNLLETNEPKTGIFYNNQFFDSHIFITDLIRKAKKRIILIDNYVDERTLNFFTKKQNQIQVLIYTNNITKQLQEDAEKFNKQYQNLELKKFSKSHDRFLVIDNEVYHIGSSLKDIGKKWTAFSKLENFTQEILEKLQ